MLYSWYIIGDRIRKNRKEKGLSQEQLAEYLEQITTNPIKRQTVAGWENGKPIKKIEQLTALCEIFDCDMAYLLCECDSKRIVSQQVAPVLGLSEKALDNLITANKNQNPYVRILSALLEDESILQYISKCTTADYGHISTHIEIPDPFSPKRTHPVLISPQDICTGDKMQLYNILCNFVDEQRRKNGLSAYNEL